MNNDEKLLLSYEIWNDYLKWLKEFKSAEEQNNLGNNCFLAMFISKYFIRDKQDLTPLNYARNLYTKYSGHIPIDPEMAQKNHNNLIKAINKHGESIEKGFKILNNDMKNSLSGYGGSELNSDNYFILGGHLINHKDYYHK